MHTLPALICISLDWMYSADKHDTFDTYPSWFIRRIHRCLMIWVRFPAGLCMADHGQKKTLYPINNEDVSCLVNCLRSWWEGTTIQTLRERLSCFHLSNYFTYNFRGRQDCCLNSTKCLWEFLCWSSGSYGWVRQPSDRKTCLLNVINGRIYCQTTLVTGWCMTYLMLKTFSFKVFYFYRVLQ